MSIPSLSLKGKVAFIAGGRRGMGKAIALLFAEAGADVAVADVVVEDGQLEAATEEVRNLGRRSLAIQVDISKKVDVEKAVQKVVDELGGIDILVNTAVKPTRSTVLELSEENWDIMFDVTLKGYFLTCQAAAKRMLEQKRGGSIINFSSAGYLRPRQGNGAYGTAKAGVVTLTGQLALELAPYNIRVNCIAPGWVRTPLSTHDEFTESEALKMWKHEIPRGRVGETEEIANVALFLASDAASYVYGSIIFADGCSHWRGAPDPSQYTD